MSKSPCSSGVTALDEVHTVHGIPAVTIVTSLLLWGSLPLKLAPAANVVSALLTFLLLLASLAFLWSLLLMLLILLYLFFVLKSPCCYWRACCCLIFTAADIPINAGVLAIAGFRTVAEIHVNARVPTLATALAIVWDTVVDSVPDPDVLLLLGWY